MPRADSTRDRLQWQSAEAARRYQETAAERERVEEQLAAGVRFPDPPDALAARAERILDRGGLSPSAVVSALHAEAMDMPEANERIINLSNELQAWSFLPRGVRVGSTVARITLRRNGRELPHGTGFLVSPRLLMTNHHVLPDKEFARQCFPEFNAQAGVDNTPEAAVRREFDPDRFFTADEHLDFALVAIASDADGRPPGDDFGWNSLSVRVGNLTIGERVNIIGHPNGRLKEIALRDNTLLVRLDEFLHYMTDTEPGNSGSPVYNDQWEVVALHHRGVPKTDGQGRVLRKDGQVWQRGDSDDTIDWIANEGVRISSILKHLATPRPDTGPDPDPLLREMGTESGLVPSGTAVPTESPQPSPPDAPLLGGSVTPPGTTRVADVRTTEAPEQAATGGVGLPARSTAADDGVHVLFLHGRRQQKRNPGDLRREWTAGLNHGLTRAGMATIDPEDVWFPFYGDKLADIMGWKEATGGAIDYAELTASAAAESFAAESSTGSYEAILTEAAHRAGMPQNGPVVDEGLDSFLVGALQRPLSWLTDKTKLDEWTIATVFRDVDRYLSDESVREAVLTCVLETVPTTRGRLVLVTHSLGTVVGMDLIPRLPAGLDLTLLVTAGSPLGMDAVNSRILAGGPQSPTGVGDWVNVWCPTDAVAIGCPLDEARWGKLTQIAVTNASDRAHNIDEYLMHTAVAKEIGGALSSL
ncbi:trypsin-like serine peptidase [Streptomyces sp. NPDC002680]|uniref:trypsin-like serine peptidase n=1 Tax=Streptomyces sp. NPDC002680 TaxID=3364659 RepID=UPI0036AE7746